jgi:hypothetical protein
MFMCTYADPTYQPSFMATARCAPIPQTTLVAQAEAARVGVVYIAPRLGQEAQERRPALSVLSHSYHHNMLGQCGHGRWILPCRSRALLKRVAQFRLTGVPSKRDEAVADLGRKTVSGAATSASPHWSLSKNSTWLMSVWDKEASWYARTHQHCLAPGGSGHEYTRPEGDDWKPDIWRQLWRTLYVEALLFMLEYIRTEQQQAA